MVEVANAPKKKQAKKKAAPKKKTPKEEQKFLSKDMEPPKVKPIEKEAQAYLDLRTERMELQEQENESRGKLKDLMLSNNLDYYRCHDVVNSAGKPQCVTMSAEDVKCKVKTAEDDD